MAGEAKVRFGVARSTVMAFKDVAHVRADEDPVEAIVASVVESLAVDLQLTVSGVTNHLAAWRDPEHWADDWREACGDEDPTEFVAGLIASA